MLVVSVQSGTVSEKHLLDGHWMCISTKEVSILNYSCIVMYLGYCPVFLSLRVRTHRTEIQNMNWEDTVLEIQWNQFRSSVQPAALQANRFLGMFGSFIHTEDTLPLSMKHTNCLKIWISNFNCQVAAAACSVHTLGSKASHSVLLHITS